MDVGLTDGNLPRGLCRDAGMSKPSCMLGKVADHNRIVEYATREQAQQAVNTLSNQNLMGRLVYVREVGSFNHCIMACQMGGVVLFLIMSLLQDRESEPRFTGPPPARGGYGGGYDGGPPRGGYGGGYGGGGGGYGGPPSSGGRQLFVNNVCVLIPFFTLSMITIYL